MAADLTQTFWGKHFEKIIVAAAGAIFLASFILFVVIRSSHDKPRKDVNTAVQNLEKRMETADLKSALPPEDQKVILDTPALTVDAFVKDLNGPAIDAGAGKDTIPPLATLTIKVTAETLYSAPRVVSVKGVQTIRGRGTAKEPVPNPVFKLDRTPYSDYVWAGTWGLVDLTEQLEEFGKLSSNPVRAPLQDVFLTRVELQRRELKNDGTWTAWQVLVPTLPAAVAKTWPKLPANTTDMRLMSTWAQAVETVQAAIRHMPLFDMIAWDKEEQRVEDVVGMTTGREQPDVAGAKAARDAAARAAAEAAKSETPSTPTSDTGKTATPTTPPPAPSTDSPFGKLPVGPPAKGVGAEPIAPPPASAKRVVVPVWAYDTTVEPGKTYQYQMRVAVRSPIWGAKEVTDASVRWLPEFVGPWSGAGNPVTIAPLVNFYFLSLAGDRANIELHRWILCQWIKATGVYANVGTPVTYSKREKLALPGTGTPPKMTADNVLIDMSPSILITDVIRSFMYQANEASRATKSAILIYCDPSGDTSRRIEVEDKKAAADDWTAHENAGAATAKPPVVPPTTPPTTPPRTPPSYMNPPTKGPGTTPPPKSVF
jgi:hypothetical protein